MSDLHRMLTVTVMDRYLTAQLTYKEEYKEELAQLIITKTELLEFLKKHHIVYGIKEQMIDRIIEPLSIQDFPIEVAKGYDKIDGENGSIHYNMITSTEVDPSFAGDFRDVMRLPVIEEGDKIATLIPPTEGKSGMTVTGKKIKPKDGKPFFLKAGKNVVFHEEDQSYYAKASGLVNFGVKSINIYSVYEVNETISMRTGNVDFNGSVIIRGDVPSGFTINASGDVKIFGLVEAATIKAGGSVYVSEGLAGLRKGNIEAGEDVYIGYINQGIVTAGRNIHVENSILHSECSAGHDITCHRGNIIGGTLFASFTIEAKDIGNHIHTPTQLSVGINHNLYEEKTKLEKEREQLQENIQKMDIIRKKMGRIEEVTDSKTRINLLKLTHSYQKMNEQLTDLEHAIQKMHVNYTDIHLSDIKVSGTMYANTRASFGKYQRKMDQDYKQVIVKVEQSDIMIRHHQM